MSRKSVRMLSMAIIMQAIEDYRDLKKKGIESRQTQDEGEYSFAELREFFASDWCRLILKDGLGVRSGSGLEILSALEANTI